MENKLFFFSIIVSLILHIVFFVRLSYSNIHYRHRPVKQVEVVYDKPQGLLRKVPIIAKQRDEKARKGDKMMKALKQKHVDSPEMVKDLNKMSDIFKPFNKARTDIAKIRDKRKVFVPALESENIENPVYLNYYHIVRQKIKEETLVNYDRYDTGEVYITFVLSAKGELQQLKLIDERSRASDYLEDVAQRSVRESAPFPDFPPDLNFPELSFNVVIYFEE